MNPYQVNDSNPGTVSEIVGRSGAASSRFAPVEAIIRSRPAFQCGMVVNMFEKENWISLPSCAVMYWATPLYGTCVMRIPVIESKSSVVRCGELPGPDVP